MKLPEQVRIGPYTFAVVVEEGLRGDQNQDVYGQIKYDTQAIRIQAGLTEERTLVTFFHEVLHGIDETLGTGLTEKQITRFAPQLTAFLVDNDLMRDD